MHRVLTYVILASAIAVPLTAPMTYSPFPTSQTPDPTRGYVTESGHAGVFHSPGYPNQYPAEYNYLYQIGTDFGKTTHLQFTHFDVADCYQCSCASVTVESVMKDRYPTQTFCGSTLPGSNGHIYIQGPAYVRFQSAAWSKGTGFFAIYTMEDSISSPITDTPTIQPFVYSTTPKPVYSTTPKPGASSLLLRMLRVQSEVRQMKDMASGLESELTSMIQDLDN